MPRSLQCEGVLVSGESGLVVVQCLHQHGFHAVCHRSRVLVATCPALRRVSWVWVGVKCKSIAGQPARHHCQCTCRTCSAPQLVAAVPCSSMFCALIAWPKNVLVAVTSTMCQWCFGHVHMGCSGPGQCCKRLSCCRFICQATQSHTSTCTINNQSKQGLSVPECKYGHRVPAPREASAAELFARIRFAIAMAHGPRLTACPTYSSL